MNPYSTFQLAQSIRDRTFRVDSFSGSLSPGNGKSLPSYNGVVCVSVDDDGILQFHLYANGVSHAPSTTGSAGEIIPEAELYSLTATDLSRTAWISESIPPSFQVSIDMRESSSVVSAPLSQITYQIESYPPELEGYSAHASLSLETIDGFDFPMNSVVQPHETPDNISGLRAARFHTEGFELSLCQRRNGGVVIDVTCPTPDLPDNLEMRVVESLQSVLGCDIEWIVMKTHERRMDRVTIRSSQMRNEHPSIRPPIAFISVDMDGKVWQLFDTYFQTVLTKAPQNAWHPISANLYSVLAGAAGSTDGEWSALGVSVEGLVNEIDWRSSDDEDWLSKSVKSVRELIDKTWKPPTGVTSDQEQLFRKRLNGLLDSMVRPSAKSQLLKLRDAGVIESSEVEAWSKLRNTYAHAVRRINLPSQAECDRAERVRTLLHKLVFLAIGYCGEYTSYAERGFPNRQFTSSQQRVSSIVSDSSQSR